MRENFPIKAIFVIFSGSLDHSHSKHGHSNDNSHPIRKDKYYWRSPSQSQFVKTLSESNSKSYQHPSVNVTQSVNDINIDNFFEVFL